MFRDSLSALLIVLVLVIGGLVYLLLPGRLNGPASNLSSVSTATNLESHGTSTKAQNGSTTPNN